MNKTWNENATTHIWWSSVWDVVMCSMLNLFGVCCCVAALGWELDRQTTTRRSASSSQTSSSWFHQRWQTRVYLNLKSWESIETGRNGLRTGVADFHSRNSIHLDHSVGRQHARVLSTQLLCSGVELFGSPSRSADTMLQIVDCCEMCWSCCWTSSVN